MEDIVVVSRSALASLLLTRSLGIVAVGLLVLLVVGVVRRRVAALEGVYPRWQVAPLLWLLAYAVPLAVVALFGYQLFSAVDEPAATRFANIALAGGCLVAARPLVDLILDLVDSRNERAGVILRVLRDVAIIAGCIYVGTVAMDVPWNGGFDVLSRRFIAISGAYVTFLLVALYFLGQRSGVLVAVGVGACCFIGLAQFFVFRFRGAPFLPSDLTALGTAFSVSSGYKYVLDGRALFAVKLALLAIAALSLVHPKRRMGAKEHAIAIARNLACAAALVAVGAAATMFVDWKAVTGMTDYWYWDEREAYEQHGFLPTFLALWKDLDIEAPDDYDEQQAQADERALVDAYDAARDAATADLVQAQFVERTPSYVFVMNESFSDLSIFDGMGVGYEGPTYFNNELTDALVKGNVVVSTYGGGTPKSEFELLTGVSMGFVGMGKVPFSTHDFTKTESIVDQFKAKGYRTVAMHPNDPTNWNRLAAYNQMGFDEFLSAGDFPENAEWYHAGLSDKVTYQMVLNLLADDASPQFIFDVTMANHGGYTIGATLPEDQQNVYPPGFEDDDINGELNEFLACMHKSDADLKWFVNELRALDRPIVLVFFGDHQPWFTYQYNDFLFADEEASSTEHRERCYQTPYFIWANYDVAGAEQTSRAQDTSTIALAARAFELTGMPLTDFQKAILAGHLQLEQLNGIGYRDKENTWYALDDEGTYAALYRQLELVSFLEYGSKM